MILVVEGKFGLVETLLVFHTELLMAKTRAIERRPFRPEAMDLRLGKQIVGIAFDRIALGLRLHKTFAQVVMGSLLHMPLAAIELDLRLRRMIAQELMDLRWRMLLVAIALVQHLHMQFVAKALPIVLGQHRHFVEVVQLRSDMTGSIDLERDTRHTIVVESNVFVALQRLQSVLASIVVAAVVIHLFDRPLAVDNYIHHTVALPQPNTQQMITPQKHALFLLCTNTEQRKKILIQKWCKMNSALNGLMLLILSMEQMVVN